MQNHYTPKHKHLTVAERRLIEKWKKEGKGNCQVAEC
ncbi:TPA: helix-turn-helix domain-containing protein [Streptococcus suis]